MWHARRCCRFPVLTPPLFVPFFDTHTCTAKSRFKGHCGKSRLVDRWINDHFDSTMDPTIEDVFHRQMSIDGCDVAVAILDTSGLEDFQALVRLSFVCVVHVCL